MLFIRRDDKQGLKSKIRRGAACRSRSRKAKKQETTRNDGPDHERGHEHSSWSISVLITGNIVFQSLLQATLFSKVFVVALGFLEKVHKTNKTSGSKVVTIPKSINQLKGIALQNSQKVELDSKT